MKLNHRSFSRTAGAQAFHLFRLLATVHRLPGLLHRVRSVHQARRLVLGANLRFLSVLRSDRLSVSADRQLPLQALSAALVQAAGRLQVRPSARQPARLLHLPLQFRSAEIHARQLPALPHQLPTSRSPYASLCLPVPGLLHETALIPPKFLFFVCIVNSLEVQVRSSTLNFKSISLRLSSQHLSKADALSELHLCSLALPRIAKSRQRSPLYKSKLELSFRFFNRVFFTCFFF